MLSHYSLSKRNFIALAVSRGFGMFMLIMPVRMFWLQQTLTNSQISFLTGWLFFSILVLELPTGALADLFGKKKTLMIGYVFQAIGLLGFLVATDFWQYFAIFSVYGLSDALKSGSVSALLYDSLVIDGKEKEFRWYNNTLMLVVQTSLVVATFLGGWIGQFDLSLPFIIYIVSTFCALVATLLVVEPLWDTETFSLQNYWRQTVDGTKHLFHSAYLSKLALLYVIVGGIGWTFQRLLRDMIILEVGYTLVGLSIIVGTVRLANILFLHRVLSLEWIRKTKWDIVLLPVLMLFAYLPGVFLNKETAIPMVIGLMMVGTARFIVYAPYLHQEIATKYRATALSAANMLVSLVLVCNMIGVGFVIDRFGIAPIMTFYGVISLLFVLPLALHVRRAAISR